MCPLTCQKDPSRCQKVGKDCKHCFINMCAARSLYFLDGNMSSLTQSGTNIICLGFGVARWFAQPNQLNKRVWLQVLRGRKNTSTVLFNTSHRGHWKSSKCCKHQWKHVFVLLPDGHEVLQSFYAMTMEKWRIQNTPRSNIRMWPNACFFPALGCFKLPAIVFLSFLAVRYLPLAAFNCLHLHPFMCCLVLPPTACYTSAPTKAKGFGI